ncbi:hypothetical protein Cha6605_5767 [Chamaesiphon minutus PCC 6605]|uniref:Uncharacterized protein n=1 Tax=Chamaesiphon minutus (strain ATCC 27169 / PCC 6605) TaxID=1173020 RepID=K9UPK8_CHAP6|nr:hypothetical protein Cha6605_5767 [Chamaesiphon minutus PCC 6605]
MDWGLGIADCGLWIETRFPSFPILSVLAFLSNTNLKGK